MLRCARCDATTAPGDPCGRRNPETQGECQGQLVSGLSVEDQTSLGLALEIAEGEGVLSTDKVCRLAEQLGIPHPGEAR